MNIKIKKENIKKYAPAVALGACLVASSVGLKINCNNTDHTTDLCIIAKILNVLPDYRNSELDYTIPQGLNHQLTYLIKDYNRKMDDPQNELATTDDGEEKIILGSTYGKITYPEKFHKKYLDGSEEIYAGESFEGEYGITTYFNDETREYLVFEKTEAPEYDPDFQLKKVIKSNQ